MEAAVSLAEDGSVIAGRGAPFGGVWHHLWVAETAADLTPENEEVQFLSGDADVVRVSRMNPEEYEHHVAQVLRAEGWDTRAQGGAHDLGIDVLGTRVVERWAVQAKMYGGTTTRVNAQQVMSLYGAAAYADCPTAMIATNGELTSEARAVSTKLGIEIRVIDADQPSRGTTGEAATSFGAIWRDFIEPLAGTQLTRSNGKVMLIESVDSSGIRRVTTGGTRQHIRIETFRWTIRRVLAGETVMRNEIHAFDPRQVSSGVLLILGAIEPFDVVSVGKSKGVELAGAR